MLQIQSFAQPKKDFYDNSSVPELRLKFDQKNWAEDLDSLRIYGDGHLIGGATIDGSKYENVGIRYRGSRSFQTGSKRNAFHIKINYINKNQNHLGYKTLKLSNALRDPSMIREVLSYEIARQYMPAPKANHIKLYINDEYYGLFINLEAINDQFLEQHFGSSDGSFFKTSAGLDPKSAANGCKQNLYGSLEYEKGANCYLNNYEIKSKEGWDDLIELTRVLNEEPNNIEKVLNVDRALWMLAFNNVLVNLSSYSGQNSQNYYLYKDQFGQFNPIIWDLNLSFGSFKNIGKGSDLKLKELQRLDPLLHVDNISKPLISQLLKNSMYQKMYLSHIRTILYDHFIDGQYEKRAKELQRLIADPVFKDKNKFYAHNEFLASLDNTTGKRSKIPGIVELMKKRASFLKKHPKISVFPPTVDEIMVEKREKFSNTMIKNFKIQAKIDKLPKRVKLLYRFNNNEAYQTVMMEDDGKSNDGKAGDKVYGATIDPAGKGDKIEYYIVAENPGAVGFGPSNYMFEPYTASLSELNK